jgi:hypothetical protein
MGGAQLSVGPNVDVSQLPGAQSEADIAMDPVLPGHLLAGSNDLTGAQVQPRVYESFDNGLTWTQALLPPPPAPLGGGGGDPTLAFDALGNAFYGHLAFDAAGNRSLVVSTKAAGQPTWDVPVIVPNVNADKDLLAVDRTSSPFRGNVYIGWHNGQWVGGNFSQQVMIARSNGARSFQAVQVNNTGSHVGGVVPAVGPDGEVYALWADWNAQTLNLNLSRDGAATWGSTDLLVQHWTATTGGSNGVRLPSTPRGAALFPSMDVDRSGGPARGTLYCVYAEGAPHLNIMLTRSSDHGSTWSAPLQLNDDVGEAHDHFFPRVSVDETTGAVNVAWYDTRNDPQNLLVDVYFAYSTSGGASFQPNLRVTAASSNETVPSANEEAYGDYLGVAASGGQAHVVWTDGRSQALGEEIYTALISGP